MVGNAMFSHTEMSRKEAKEAAERTKKILLVGAVGLGAWYLLKPSAPRIDNLAMEPLEPQRGVEGYYSDLFYAAKFQQEAYQPGGTMLAGLGDVGYTADMALPVSDDPAASLKLRRIQVVRADEPVSTTALRAYTMNTNQRAKRANRDIPSIVRAVIKKYGRILEEAAVLHNVPAALLATKICIENPDLLASVVTGGQATGIMQISPGTAASCLRTELKKGHLTGQEVSYFAAKMGQDRWAAMLRGQGAIRVTDLQKPEFNIHVGALAFGQMLRKYTNLATGEVEVYKAAAEYNRGIRAETVNRKVSSPDQLIAYSKEKYGALGTPAITQQYVMMYCGPGGPMDYITANGLLS